MKISNPFHLVTPSPWPIITSICLLSSAITFIMSLHSKFSIIPTTLSILILVLSAHQWWRDVVRESSFQGNHTTKITQLLKMSMILFITSEVFFFISFFWAFFHSSISPNIEIGSHWPPLNIQAFNPMSIPLLNSIILVSSGSTITWSHHAILSKKLKISIISLIITILLGIYFSILQAFEYIQSPFSFSDSIYGSTFFITTGFHGLHVIIGSSFLLITLIRLSMSQNSSNHIVGMELSAWYWHFVDVVWLFLFISIYWWGR